MARNAEGECTCADREFQDFGVLDSGQQVAWYRCPDCGVWAWKPVVFVRVEEFTFMAEGLELATPSKGAAHD